MMDWFRSHHGAPTDPKWQVIARRAGVAPVVVVAVFWNLLDYASQHEERGSISGFDIETCAVFLDVEEQSIERVIGAMYDKGILENHRIGNWDKRQPKREREDNSTERVREYRTRQREETPQSQQETPQSEGDVSRNESGVSSSSNTLKHHVTPRNANETPCNATERLDKIREEKRREEHPPTPLPQGSGEGGGVVAGKIFQGGEPLPIMVQNFIASKGNQAGRWEEELRLEIYGRTIRESPAAYMLRLLREWERDGLPERKAPLACTEPTSDPNVSYRAERRRIAAQNRQTEQNRQRESAESSTQ